MDKAGFYKRYQFSVAQDRIGGGSFGTVYKAEDTVSGKMVAIKIAPVREIGEKKYTLQSEFEVIKDLDDHPNIANYEAVYQFETEAGITDYAVMQYYESGNLKNLLRREDLNSYQKQFIANGIIQGLQFLHDNNIIHRDLKPANILIEKVGDDYIPKVADFGLSKILPENDDEASYQVSFAGGTYKYSSPEQLQGDKVLLNSDIWSVGVILYEIFMQKLPFDSKLAVPGNGLLGPLASRIRGLFSGDGGSTVSRKTSQGNPNSYIYNLTKNALPADIDEVPVPYDYIVSESLIYNPRKRLQSLKKVIPLIEGTVVVPLPSRKKQKLWRILLLLLLLMIFPLFLFLQPNGKLLKGFNADDNYKTVQILNEEDKTTPSYDWATVSALIGSLKENEDADKVVAIVDSLLEVEGASTALNEDQLLNKETALIQLDKVIAPEQKSKRIQEEIKKIVVVSEDDEWQKAEKTNTLASYRSFLAKYPSGKYTQQANTKMATMAAEIEKTAWDKAVQTGSKQGYESYLKQYPNGRFSTEAQTKINELETKAEPIDKPKDNAERAAQESWLKIKDSNDPKELASFINEYSNSPFAKEAKEALDAIREAETLAFETAMESKDIEVLNQFLQSHPNSDYASQVIDKIDDLTWALVAKTNSVEAYNGYLKAFTDGRHANKAERNIKIIEGNKVLPSSLDGLMAADEFIWVVPKDPTVDPFFISKYEVTQEDYTEIMGDNPSYYNEKKYPCPTCPVETLTRMEAEAYIRKLNNKQNNPYTYRLPTIQEWESAARGGSNTKYAGSDDPKKVAVFGVNGTERHATKIQNELGLFDMSGNVAEFCIGPGNSTVSKGGCSLNKADACEIEATKKLAADMKDECTGFRLVRQIK